MKRQRCRSEEYRARRWKLKAKRRQRRDPDGSRGIFTQDDQLQVNGFESVAEFHRMVARVDLSGEGLAAFKKWQALDGTKQGLALLAVQP